MAAIDPDTLLAQGVMTFNAGEYYDAHEYWEELWSEYQLPDRIFIQGLIQLAVGYFHLTNDNLTGARSLFAKALPKLEQGSADQRSLNVDEIRAGTRATIEQVEHIEACVDFEWGLVPKIKIAVSEGT